MEKDGMIDLTMSDGEEEDVKDVKVDAKGKGKEAEEVMEADDFGAVALSEEEFALGGLEEILNSLSGEQLQTLGRQMKVANRGTTVRSHTSDRIGQSLTSAMTEERLDCSIAQDFDAGHSLLLLESCEAGERSTRTRIRQTRSEAEASLRSRELRKEDRWCVSLLYNPP